MTFRITDPTTGKSEVVEAKSALELVRKYDLATESKSHLKITQLTA